MRIVKHNKCRLCGSKNLTELFSLGNLFISTFIDSKKSKTRKAPLELVLCNTCTLVQLRHTAPQELLYSGHYWYKSGINEKIINDLKQIGQVGMQFMNPGDVWLDIGANDGTLLKNLPDNVIKVGCEPAKNFQYDLALNSNFYINDFWSFEKYFNLDVGKAKVITAIGMFYDMENPAQFVRDAVKALAKDGIFIAQLMTLKPMLEKNDLGNICHEHIEYYSYESLKFLFESCGLEIFKVEENDINGGSYRIYARHFKKGSIDYPEKTTIKDILKFYKRLSENKEKVVRFIEKKVKEGKKVYGYGASTKGSVVLQWYELDEKLITAVADRNPEKYGKLMVGVNIPVVSEEQARKDADYFLILPWGFAQNFIEREKDWLSKGGAFISHTPKFNVFKQ